MNYNERIKKARIEKKLNQEEIAKLLGITRGCYAHYEQGVREPSLELLKKICIVLDISSDYIIGLSEY